MTIRSPREHFDRRLTRSFAVAGTAMAAAGLAGTDVASAVEVSLGALVVVVALDQRPPPARPLLVGRVACTTAARAILAATLAYMAVAAGELVLRGIDIASPAPLALATPVAGFAARLVGARCKTAHRRRRWPIGGPARSTL